MYKLVKINSDVHRIDKKIKDNLNILSKEIFSLLTDKQNNFVSNNLFCLFFDDIEVATFYVFQYTYYQKKLYVNYMYTKNKKENILLVIVNKLKEFYGEKKTIIFGFNGSPFLNFKLSDDKIDSIFENNFEETEYKIKTKVFMNLKIPIALTTEFILDKYRLVMNKYKIHQENTDFDFVKKNFKTFFYLSNSAFKKNDIYVSLDKINEFQYLKLLQNRIKKENILVISLKSKIVGYLLWIDENKIKKINFFAKNREKKAILLRFCINQKNKNKFLIADILFSSLLELLHTKKYNYLNTFSFEKEDKFYSVFFENFLNQNLKKETYNTLEENNFTLFSVPCIL